MSNLDRATILQTISDIQIDSSGGQAGIAFEYFLEQPDQDVEHDDIVP